jgi:hypothetical protein
MGETKKIKRKGGRRNGRKQKHALLISHLCLNSEPKAEEKE